MAIMAIITVNGEKMSLERETMTVREVLTVKNWSFPLIIVKINGELVHRGAWDEASLRDGDVMEAIHLVSGG